MMIGILTSNAEYACSTNVLEISRQSKIKRTHNVGKYIQDRDKRSKRECLFLVYSRIETLHYAKVSSASTQL